MRRHLSWMAGPAVVAGLVLGSTPVAAAQGPAVPPAADSRPGEADPGRPAAAPDTAPYGLAQAVNESAEAASLYEWVRSAQIAEYWRLVHEAEVARRAASPFLVCTRELESHGDYTAVSADGTYRGAYQFDQQTWESVGGTGDPAAAPPEEQDARAAQLYAEQGSAPWGGRCGS
jgi:Transglycosylase-like domain